MSAAGLHHSEIHGDLTIKQICQLKYPIARPHTVRGLLRRMSVDEAIAYDVIAGEINGRRKGIKKSRAANEHLG